MKTLRRTFINLALYSLPLFAIPAILILIFPLRLTLADLLLYCSVFFFITSLSLLVFFAGNRQSTDSQSVFTMASLGIKFFLSMAFALIYFIVMKNTVAEYIVLFFFLYLGFTFYLLGVIVKALNVKPLK